MPTFPDIDMDRMFLALGCEVVTPYRLATNTITVGDALLAERMRPRLPWWRRLARRVLRKYVRQVGLEK